MCRTRATEGVSAKDSDDVLNKIVTSYVRIADELREVREMLEEMRLEKEHE